tara:strand:+ start:1277 stop:2002 length:726 start_codon:yes stop_codon:yes gene_type:complete
MEKLEVAIKRIGIDTKPEIIEKLRTFGDFIEKYNKVQNLTSNKSWDEIRDNLFIRSLSIYKILGRLNLTNLKIIDVGTGSGIPGLLIKILNPETNMCLLDSNKKKVEFLKIVVSELKINGIELVHSRSEKLGKNSVYREEFDIVVSRGVAKLNQLAELTIPFCKLQGLVICLKGNNIDQELKISQYASNILGAEKLNVIPVDYDENELSDSLVVWEKTKLTPPKFPRRDGIPKKTPLTKNI